MAEFRTRGESSDRGWKTLLAAFALSGLLAGCGGGPDPASSGGSPTGGSTGAGTTGTGTLTVSVVDAEGRTLRDASVYVSDAQSRHLGDGRTNGIGEFTIVSVPQRVRVTVDHAFGEHYSRVVDVAQAGNTFLEVVLSATRPLPTVALLPVSVPAWGVNADRSQVTLEVTIVASASTPFAPAGYGDYPGVVTPSLGLELGTPGESWQVRECFVWLDRTRTAPSCGMVWGESPYTVSVTRYDYDPVGVPPALAERHFVESAMLLLDQSARVALLDPAAARSFAARAFFTRALSSHPDRGLAVAGFAGDGGAGSATLPERPLWLPLGTDVMFTSDRAFLGAATTTLEPYIGGSATVFDALDAAFSLMAAHAPPGGRAVVALLGGGDESGLSAPLHQEALASLQQQRAEAGIQTVLIAATAQASERGALAELSVALRAPSISLGLQQSWESGAYAALDLAADLIDGAPLPALSATFVVSANEPGAFVSGAILEGTLFVESHLCPMGCAEIPIEFVAEIP